MQPSALRWFRQPVVEIKQISAYSCRGMVGAGTSRISEHAFGNALDIAAFILADGRKITVKNGWEGTPEEAGFKLQRAPRPFSLHTSRHLMRLLGKGDDQWRKYLFY